MKKKTFKVPIYDYTVVFIEIESSEDADKVVPIFKSLKMVDEDIESEVARIKRGCYDGGNTWRNLERKTFMILLYPFSSSLKRRNVLNHEKRHLEDRILEHCQINDLEAAGYLAGFLSEKIY